jgi:hypothetical protein
MFMWVEEPDFERFSNNAGKPILSLGRALPAAAAPPSNA